MKNRNWKPEKDKDGNKIYFNMNLLIKGGLGVEFTADEGEMTKEGALT